MPIKHDGGAALFMVAELFYNDGHGVGNLRTISGLVTSFIQQGEIY